MGRLLTIRNGQNDGPLAFSHNFLTQQGVPAGFAFTRADASTCATRIGQGRFPEAVAASVLRSDINPATGAPRGILLEPQRSNSLRNAAATGATAGVIGSGGVLPTDWNIVSTQGGLSVEVVGVVNGALRVRLFGTTSNTTPTILQFAANTFISASSGQTWAGSLYVGLAAGSLGSPTTSRIALRERNSGGTTLNQTNTSISPTTANVYAQRALASRLLTEATTSAVGITLDLAWASGVSVDVTFDVAAPQMENTVLSASSFIRTTGASSLTRAADLLLANTPALGISAGDDVSVYAEFEYMGLSTTSGQRVFELGIDSSNRMGFGVLSGGNLGTYITNGGSSVTANGVIGPTAGTIYKVAATYRVGSCSICVNGGSVASVTAAAIPSYNKIAIGSAATGGTNIGGWVRAFGIQKGTITAATMQAITR